MSYTSAAMDSGGPTLENRRLLWLVLLAAAFAVSLGTRLIWQPERVERVLFFPGTAEDTLTGEVRLLPRPESLRKDILNVAEDLLLGPSAIEHGRALPRTAHVNSVILSGDRLFLDISTEALFASDEVRADLSVGLDALYRTLSFNFRSLDQIVLTIGGQIPYEPPFDPQRSFTLGAANKVVDKEMAAAIISDKVLLLAELQANRRSTE